ncbi:relaxase domain-containing protein, partial [Frankia sp. CNm7]
MIATAKVLRVQARDTGEVAKAARAVVHYVQGGQAPSVDPLARYFGRGRARGSAAELVGLRGEVPALALERLLRGEHAVTGRPLLAAAGSAGRVIRLSVSADAAAREAVAIAGPDDLLTLAQASEVAGVSAAYLRLLVSRSAEARAAAPADAATQAGIPDPGDEAARTGDGLLRGSADQLTGVRGRRGWLVRRGELERWCVARTPPATVLGYDVVCAAPKSVSLLWAFGDEALRADVAAALDAAVDATISYLERHGAFGVVRGQSRHALGLAVASYLHDVSRSVEAHLHVHNIVINAVVVATHPDGQDPAAEESWDWRALDGELFLAEVKTAGYVGAAVLRHELTARRGVVWEPARNGVAEIASFPVDLLAAFSTRHREVVEEFTQLVAAGFEPSGATEAAAQRGSRVAKRVQADAEVQVLQAERLAVAGFTVDQVRGLAPARSEPVRSTGLGKEQVAVLFDGLAGAFGLTEHATTFTRRDVVQHIAGLAGDRLDADGIEHLVDRFLADRRVVVLHDTTRTRRRHQPAAVYTVENLLTAEDTLLALVRQGEVAAGAAPRLLIDPATLETQLAALTHRATTARPGAGRAEVDDAPPASPVSEVAEARWTSCVPASAERNQGRRRAAERGDHLPTALATTASAAGRPVLTAEQIGLLRRLLTSGDLVRPFVGPAGTGKTEAMRALTAIVTAAGRRVFATAHGGRQAEELAERIGVPTRVVASWLTLLDHVDDPAQVWPAGSVLIVDEATQVSTRHAERLLRHATRTGTVVIALGDPAQLGSVDAGGWFTHLVADTVDVPALVTVHRQAGAEMAPIRAALAALRADAAPATRAALDRLAAAGHIVLAETADQLLERAVADWYTERRQVIHPTTDATSAQVRATPDGANGANGAEPRRADGGNGADGARSSMAPRPAMVRMMAERQRDVDTLNTAARALLTADGTLTGPVLAVAGREFQVGDEVITLTQAGHTLIPAGRPKSAYIRTGTVGVITTVHLADDPAAQALEVYFPSKGTVRVPWEYLTHRFEDGRDGGLGHAYAITAAKAQGATMDTARAVVPDDTTRPALYVMLSRTRRDLHAYVLRRDELRDSDDDEGWLPTVTEPDGPLERLADRLARTRTERLATDHDPDVATVHQLRTRHTLAELTALRLEATPSTRIAPHEQVSTAHDRSDRADAVGPRHP